MSALTFLSNDSYGRFNVELAHQLGLEESIYIEALLCIKLKAQRKNAISEDGSFKVDRKYIEERTTIPRAKQVEIDKELEVTQIICESSDNKDIVYLDTDKLMNLSLNLEDIKKENIPIIETQRAKKKTKQFKETSIKENLYANVTCLDKELQVAYCTWIDEVYTASKPITKATVVKAQEDIDRMCQNPDGTHDLDKALELIKITTANHWTDMTYALRNYNEMQRNMSMDRQNQAKGVINKTTAPTVPKGIDVNLFDRSKQF